MIYKLNKFTLLIETCVHSLIHSFIGWPRQQISILTRSR